MADSPTPSEIEPHEQPASLVEGDAAVPGTNPPAAVPGDEPGSVAKTPSPDRVDDSSGAAEPE